MSSPLSTVAFRAAVVAGVFLIAAVGISFLPLGSFHSLLMPPYPAAVKWARLLTIFALGFTISWALHRDSRPLTRTAIVVLGSLVLSEFALVAAYLMSRLY